MDAPVYCPRPRRIVTGTGEIDADNHHWMSMLSQQLKGLDLSDSEDLDIAQPKDYFFGGVDQLSGSVISSSPPYFCGSPPIRATNPIVNDAHFLEEKNKSNLSITPPHSPFTSPLSPSRKGGFAFQTTKFVSKNQETVRIEGFDCLNIDTHGRGIPAFA